MADESSFGAHHAGDDTRLCPTELHQHFSVYLNGASSSSYASSSPFFETICGSLYRKKLEKGQVQYREVLAEDKRLQLIQAFHVMTPGVPHHTQEDTYRLVAEHYWWEGMYFQVRDFVRSCEECHLMWNEKADCSEIRNVSKMVKSHSHKVLSKLNSQREAGLFCDITLKTGNGHSFVAHKSVLAAVSEYFQELFTEMDSAAEPQLHVDLTDFSEESLLALLEFSYTSTLTLNLGTLTEVAAMARHLRMWPALEACSALQSEQEAGQQSTKLLTPVEASSATYGSSSMNSFSLDRMVGFKRKRGKSLLGVTEIEGTDESDQESFAQTLPIHCQSQVLFGPQAEDNGFPCSPTRRMKLMDFKSPSSKRKLSPRPSSSVISSSPSTTTRSSSPSRRLLRSSPGAALALRRLLPKIDLATKRKRKSSSFHQHYRVKPDNSAAQSHSQSGLVTPVKVKQEAEVEDLRYIVPQDEVQSPHAQEKYQLLSFLGLQRRSLVPGPEERAGWGQKKRLRKPKVSDYCLTTRRKPRAQSQGSYATNLEGFVGVSPSLSLCDLTRMDLLNKVIKVEPHVGLDKRSKRKRDTVGQIEQLSVRTTRSQSLHAGLFNDRPLRSHSRRSDISLPGTTGRERVTRNTLQKVHPLPKKASFKTKEEPAEFTISQPVTSGTRRCKVSPVTSSKGGVSAPKVGPPVSRSSTITTTQSRGNVHYNMGSTMTGKHKAIRKNRSAQEKSKQSQNSVKVKTQPEQSGRAKDKKNKKNTPHEKKTEENAADLQGTRGWNLSNTNHEHYNNPLYRTIKEEPADPLPLTQPFLTSDVPDLGKRQSKPPVKLLDQGFLFGFCRPPGGIKREEESVDICLTRSVSHSNMSPTRRDRIQARLSSDGSGLNGPHWAGFGNRSTSSSRGWLLRVKKEEEKTSIAHQSKTIRRTSQLSFGKKRCKVKKEPPKTKNVNKLHPASSRHTVMMESIRRARVGQFKQTRGQSSSGVHSCLQCRASYSDCDSLIMHRIRHIEGKHWPCPLCSKTFFREINVRNHIRTHNPKLYKCRQCIAAS